MKEQINLVGECYNNQLKSENSLSRLFGIDGASVMAHIALRPLTKTSSFDFEYQTVQQRFGHLSGGLAQFLLFTLLPKLLEREYDGEGNSPTGRERKERKINRRPQRFDILESSKYIFKSIFLSI